MTYRVVFFHRLLFWGLYQQGSYHSGISERILQCVGCMILSNKKKKCSGFIQRSVLFYVRGCCKILVPNNLFLHTNFLVLNLSTNPDLHPVYLNLKLYGFFK